LPQQLLWWSEHRPGEFALRQKDYGIWQPVTWREYAARARHFGLGLIELGLERGKNVALLSENRKEWVFAQLGIGLAGGIVAGVYPTSPASEVEYLLALSDAPLAVVEDQEQLDKVLAVRERLPELCAIVVIDPRGLRHYDRAGIYDFDDVLEMGKRLERERPGLLEERVAQQRMDDIGLVVFTSGSTGRPKAAMLSWRGLGHAARGLNCVMQLGEADEIVSYLPLCHVAEQMFSVQIPLATGARVNFAESLRTVQEDLRELAPRIFFGVPRIWEKFHSAIQIKLREAGGIRLWLYDRAMAALGGFVATSRAGWTLGQRVLWRFWYFVILRALLNFVGLRSCRLALSSGAPIAPEILHFFRILGVPIREAYGCTEASGAATMQPRNDSPVGTVGGPLPGVELRLADDGEILIHGGVVFRGYYKNDEGTRDAIDRDGWLHTGDVARWEDGPSGRELRIIDRKKDIMITSGGKNITPSEIENSLRFSPYIKEAIIIADRRRFVSALIQIDFEAVGKWAEEQNLLYTNFKSLAELPAVHALIEKEIAAVNGKMPQVQNVRKFHLLAKELDHDDAEVTATMKVRRKSISEKYSTAIEAMYA
jgi:long-chain acyl-CoA synthetase